MYINIKILPGMGASDGIRELLELKHVLLRYLPQLSLHINCCKQFPPFHILNEELLTGGRDQGMSGGSFWKPFEISIVDYNELKEDVLTDPELDFKYDQELEIKRNVKQWCGAVMTKHNPRRRKAT
ncbi:MAG: hypothetical protein OCD00_15185 [Colwellia sp.]